jgi:molecular chaperone GrpE (heat shock protein)
MLGNFDVKILLLVIFLVIFAIVVCIYLIQVAIDQNLTLKSDALLLELMERVGIPNWKTLKAKSGLNKTAFLQLRDNEAAKLKFTEIANLATVFNLPIFKFLEKLNIVQPNPELELSRQECSKLQQQLQQIATEQETFRQEQLEQQRVELTNQFRNSTFEQLQILLTNYPSIHQMVEVNPELPAKNLLSMFTPLDNLLSEWGYQTIGKPCEQVACNPQIHQPDATDISEGELVYIRIVGYQHQDKVLCPAKVSRTLPENGG